jgi:hypothetical protein
MGPPVHHGAGDAEIIVMPWETLVDNPARPHFGLKGFQLFISASRRRPIG